MTIFFPSFSVDEKCNFSMLSLSLSHSHSHNFTSISIKWDGFFILHPKTVSNWKMKLLEIISYNLFFSVEVFIIQITNHQTKHERRKVCYIYLVKLSAWVFCADCKGAVFHESYHIHTTLLYHDYYFWCKSREGKAGK